MVKLMCPECFNQTLEVPEGKKVGEFISCTSCGTVFKYTGENTVRYNE